MNEDAQTQEQAELEALKARADQLGVKYHPNIKAESLSAKIEEAVNESESGEDSGTGSTPEKEQEPGTETRDERRARIRKQATELVRVRVTCMDPNKKEWEGEIFSVGNSVIGTVKKYVPYEVEWHIPRIMLNKLKKSQYQTFVTTTTPRGDKVKRGKLVRSYAIEELPPLTEKELKELSQRQAMARGQAE